MPTVAQNLHAWNNTRRHRTPRIARVEQVGTSSLTITFDRPMDVQFNDSKIRTVDPVNGVVDWSDGTWTNDRTLTTSSSNVFNGSYSGPSFAVYLEGNLRGKARYPLLNGDRCERLEVTAGGDFDIDGGNAGGVQTEEDIDGGTAAGSQLEPAIDGGAA